MSDLSLLENQDSMADLEEHAFEIFRRKYTVTRPPPDAPGETLLSNLGWQFWMVLFTSMASLLLAASRTAEAFYENAFRQFNAIAVEFGLSTSTAELMSIGEASLAVFAIEGVILVSAIRLAHRRLTRGGEKKTSSEWRMWLAILMTGFISMVAGTSQGLISWPDAPLWARQWIQALLAFAIGPAASIAVFVMGEVLGEVVAEASIKLEGYRATYETEMVEWDKKMVRQWGRDRKSMMGIAPTVSVTTAQEVTTRPAWYAPAVERYGRELTIKEKITEWCLFHDVAISDVTPAQIYATFPDLNQSSIRVYLSELKNVPADQ